MLQTDVLLAPPPKLAVTNFFQRVTAAFPGLEVRLESGQGKGKGLFAAEDFRSEDELIVEQPLVAIQHTANCPLAHACGQCFQHLGSVEEQIALQLGHHRKGVQELEGSEELSSDGSSCSSSAQRGPDAEDLVSALLSGSLRLPLSDHVKLPAAICCPGGCSREKYCSQQCAEKAWNQHHCLLCPGSCEMPDAAADTTGKGKGAVHRGCLPDASQHFQRQTALQEFIAHADETNDAFLLAARVVSTVLLGAQKVLAAVANKGSSQEQCARSSADPATSASVQRSNTQQCLEALQAAWEPFAMGHKAVWWECVAVPEDVDDEAEFRQGIKGLAADSLELLRTAIYDERFPALFDLRVWGSIIGMFELNNLNLYVPSPIRRWHNLIEDLPDLERAVVLKEIGSLLEAMDEMEDCGCEGNAFYTLQSCINHSCVPNAHAFKRDRDVDGSAVILALRSIKAGEEITISYIDEDASLAERAAELADYGFTCTCEKCAADRLAQELQVS